MSRKKEPAPCNPLCGRCLRHCKQLQTTLLVDCPRFQPFPFKVEKHRYEQLDLFGEPSAEN